MSLNASNKQVRPAPFFIADEPALDFLNTVGAPWGKEIEWLEDGPDLMNWLSSAGLLPAEVATDFAGHAADRLDKVAADARALREWLRGHIDLQINDPNPKRTATALSKINPLLAKTGSYQQIDIAAADGAPILSTHRHWTNPEDLLAPLAEAIATFICTTGLSRTRNCEGPTCTMWFNDISKNHTRRWCTMAVCGNRAKAAAFRAKKKRR